MRSYVTAGLGVCLLVGLSACDAPPDARGPGDEAATAGQVAPVASRATKPAAPAVATGPTGPTGPTGTTGPSRAAGRTGASGPTGPSRAAGRTGASGPTGPAAADEASKPSKAKGEARVIARPAVSISPKDRTLSWTAIAEITPDFKFARFDHGVLGFTKEAAFARSASAGLKPVDHAFPRVRSWFAGHYPKDAWVHRLRSDDSSQMTWELRRLRGNGRWVAQDLGGTTIGDDMDEELLVKSAKAGFLVAKQQGDVLSLTRVAPAGVLDPEPVAGLGGQVHEVFESGAGRVWVFVEQARQGRTAPRMQVRRGCSTPSCVDENTFVFPGEDSKWRVEREVARGRHSASFAVLEVRGSGDAAIKSYGLLHLDKDIWHLETLANGRRVAAMWATGSGLWALTYGPRLGPGQDDPASIELWYRDPNRDWSRAGLPRDFAWFKRPEIALTGTGPEAQLWIAGAVGGKSGVWSTLADPVTPQSKAAAPEAGQKPPLEP